MLAIEFRGHGDIPDTDGSSLGVIGGEQTITAPSGEHRRELPAQTDRVADAGIHPERAGRRQLMDGVACEKDASARIAFSYDAASRPDTGAEPLDLESAPEGTAQIAFAIDRFGRQAGTGIED